MVNRRTRLAEGIFADRWGISACVKLGGVQHEKRFKRGTPLERMETWRLKERVVLDADRGKRPTPATGTLRQEGIAFIERRKGRAAYKADRSHLRAWFEPFGDRSRHTLTREDIERQIATWRTAKKPAAARTIRHRCRVLRELFHALDGPEAKTPLDHMTLPAPPAPRPAAVPLKTIQAVARRLRDANLPVDYARFLVRATTGQRPAQIMKATPDDLDFRRRIWFVRPSKGGTPIPMPLNNEMIAAWKAFAAANAWGAFDTGRAADVLREHGWPKDVRPYDLRHTFAIDLLLSGADLGDVQGLLGHTQIQTTRAHYAPILTARLRKVTARRKLAL